MDKHAVYGATVLRIALGVIFLAHSAYLKIFVFTIPGTVGFFESLGLPALLAYAVLAVEVIGGLLLVAGVAVREAATALAVVALGATWAHSGAGWLFSNEGGGWPGTFEDIARGADHLGAIAADWNLDRHRVMAMGHSAGGHLALWLAARHRLSPQSPVFVADPLPVYGAVGLAPAADLELTWHNQTCGGASQRLMGGSPDEFPERYRDGNVAYSGEFETKDDEWIRDSSHGDRHAAQFQPSHSPPRPRQRLPAGGRVDRPPLHELGRGEGRRDAPR